MAVIVNKSTSSEATYAEATDYSVRDGHLFVVKTDGVSTYNVAVYVPGKWYMAQVLSES